MSCMNVVWMHPYQVGGTDVRLCDGGRLRYRLQVSRWCDGHVGGQLLARLWGPGWVVEEFGNGFLGMNRFYESQRV
jgi:hypothetical protein